MSRIGRWKEVFGKSEKPKMTVRTRDSFEELTDTQAYRFEELTNGSDGVRSSENENPFDQSRYSLGDVAFRLMTTELDVLGRAASGTIDLFVPVDGLAGRWRYLAPDGRATISSGMVLRSGYLALTIGACEKLAEFDNIEVEMLVFPKLADPAALGFDGETQAVLSTSGNKRISFYLTTSREIDRDGVVIMAPLVARS